MTDPFPPTPPPDRTIREAEVRAQLWRTVRRTRLRAAAPADEISVGPGGEPAEDAAAPPAPADPPADRPSAPEVEAATEEAATPDAGPAHLRETRSGRLRSAVEWVTVVLGALVVALVVKTFLIQAFYIPSGSMEPTLEKGDRVLVNKLSYDLHDVNRGDVIVFELPDDEVGVDGIKDLIKRVIGLPGDVIETRDGIVYINDRPLEEPYLAPGTLTGDATNGQNPPIARQTVPEGHVYVLGDNRANSADSRFPERGPIPIESIVGRAFVLVWPLGDATGL